MKKILLTACILLAQVGAHAEDFYGIPVHPDAAKKEIAESKEIPVATMRYVTNVKPEDMKNYYKSKLPGSAKVDDLGDTIMFSYKVGDKNKMVSILDYFGKSDVTVQSEK